MMGHEAARRGYERLMHGISAMDVAGEYDLPTMEPMDVSCDTFIGFNYAKSSFAVSTIGCVRNKADELLFRRGMSAACEACNPSKVLLFGKPLDFECDAEVINVKMVRPWKKGA